MKPIRLQREGLVIEVLPTVLRPAHNNELDNEMVPTGARFVNKSIEEYSRSVQNSLDENRDELTESEQDAMEEFFSILNTRREFSRISQVLRSFYGDTLIMKERIQELEEALKNERRKVDHLRKPFERAQKMACKSYDLLDTFVEPEMNDWCDIVHDTAKDILNDENAISRMLDNAESVKQREAKT